ncbi:inositol monophosphatase [Odoribacter laneus]|jgi:inositol monophosphatase|uniref:inositol monophosphatase family protein n=1 Tax=Odoribacter laneus TaxID=626933 RepID=UPI0018975919|nr:inositol monophosphatase family protein [Odoribacter laneus]GKI22220.1 inositol monophosphatase [Odoribacter laneus]GKI24663.1 inositol monophosphatase [Odoribacter laneus]
METEQIPQTGEFLTAAIAWAKKVGKIHLAYFRGNRLDIHTKSNVADVVTRADRESEAYLLEKIAERFPTHSVLGEESGMHEKNTDFCWVVDPLDGTNNYSQGLPVFTVSIGLQYRGHTLIGVVYAPYFDELYTAERGKGAFLNGRPLQVSAKTDLESCVLGTGFPYDKGTNPENNIANLASILPGLRGIRRMGSAAYDLCCVAAGFLDGYWELNLNLWDVCAGELLVEEAGGCICPFRQDRHISIIAANGVLVEKIRHLIR